MLVEDLVSSCKNWRFIHLLGAANLRTRYARSKLGQTWLTISFFIQILSIGTVWSVLWNQPFREFLPYVAVSMVIYQLFSTVISDSTTLFVSDSRLYMNQRLPFLTSVLASFYKNMIVFAHNLPILIGFLMVAPSTTYFSMNLLPMLVLVACFLMASSYVLACVCTRYRDTIQIVSSVMNILFLLTPIMWQINRVPVAMQGVFYLNPFAAFLEIFRNPLLGMSVNVWAYYSVLGWTTLSLMLMLYLYRRFETRIIYWI